MAEKLCLQWNDFKDNAIDTFGSLREDKDFTDVTLVCEDGMKIDVHKVILANSSPFFDNVLRQNKHIHPLIYMRGVKSEDLFAIVDFLYCGEANIYQESLDSFLAIAGEIQLKGLAGAGKTSIMELLEERENVKQNAMTGKDSFATSIPGKREPTATPNTDASGIKISKELSIQDHPGGEGEVIDGERPKHDSQWRATYAAKMLHFQNVWQGRPFKRHKGSH